LPDEQCEALIDLCWSVDTLDDAGTIARTTAKK